MNLFMPEAYAMTAQEMFWQWLYVLSIWLCVGRIVGGMFCEDINSFYPRSGIGYFTKGVLVLLEASGLFSLWPHFWITFHVVMLAIAPNPISVCGTVFSCFILWPASVVLMMKAWDCRPVDA